jgi:tRNA(adenine34) deaminase
VEVTSHESFMRLALQEARTALQRGEVPVGAVVVSGGKVVASGFNQPIQQVDPTAHAEIVALRGAARALENYRLTGSILYVTVEPCLMCVGALVHARVETVVFGPSGRSCAWRTWCSTTASTSSRESWKPTAGS